jgi:hypothetical protein
MILDTCALLWLASGDKKLSRTALKEIDAAAAVYVSAISGFEIAIKVASGKLKLPAQAPQAGTQPQMWSHACTPAAKWTSAKPGASGRTTACSCGPRAASNPKFSPPPSGAFYRHRLRCALFTPTARNLGRLSADPNLTH